MTVWDDVKLVLRDLEGTDALIQWPGTKGTGQRAAPIPITLAAWATDAAEDLHRRFGDDVELIVGAFRYPTMRPTESPLYWPEAEDIDPKDFRVELEGETEVRSGHNLRTGLRVHNLTEASIALHTNGHILATVIDPATGEPFGRDVRARQLCLVRMPVAPGESLVVPLVIGTASLRPELGYSVPPGEWAVSADLRLENGRVLRTPLMPITVTA